MFIHQMKCIYNDEDKLVILRKAIVIHNNQCIFVAMQGFMCSCTLHKSMRQRGMVTNETQLLAVAYSHVTPGQQSSQSQLIADRAVMVKPRNYRDRVIWNFLLKALQDFGFHQVWSSRIFSCIIRHSFSLLINGFSTEYFTFTVDLHQGCPLFSSLFIIYADFLLRALRAAVQESVIQPFFPVPGAPLISHLLFAVTVYSWVGLRLIVPRNFGGFWRTIAWHWVKELISRNRVFISVPRLLLGYVTGLWIFS